MKSRIFIPVICLSLGFIGCTESGKRPHRGASSEVINGDTINRTDDNGMKQRHWIYYKMYPKFAPVEEGEYVNNQKQGAWKLYDSSGKVNRIVNFNHDIAR
jgi:hypothetical protein